jgi:uncharacterized SAM-dependent methyltransferase
MNYFKNTELAKLYNVSEKTVRNWIQAATEGKLELHLYEKDGRQYIANTIRNTTLIETLVQNGKKYTNTRGYKVITPTPKFYKIFKQKEIFDIISNIDIYGEVPHRYSYFNGGASDWDLYVQKLSKESATNILSNTVELLDMSMPYVDRLLAKFSKINIIDIGPGNCFPVRDLLKHYADNGKLNRYIGIDISQDMLDIAEKNIREWFGSKVTFEGYARDVNYDRFEDLLVSDSFGKDSSIANIVLFLGSTIANFREPGQSLHMIHESMGKNDLLVFSRSLDTENVRRYFDFATGPENIAALSSQESFVLDLLNIDKSLYEVEQYFDEKEMARRIQVRLKVALSIEFQLSGQTRVISFNKGDTILLWQHKHQNLLDIIQQFDEGGFNLLGARKSTDEESMLAISKIKTSY